MALTICVPTLSARETISRLCFVLGPLRVFSANTNADRTSRRCSLYFLSEITLFLITERHRNSDKSYLSTKAIAYLFFPKFMDCHKLSISASKLCFANRANWIQIRLLSIQWYYVAIHFEYVIFSMNMGQVIQYTNTVQAACDCMPVLLVKYMRFKIFNYRWLPVVGNKIQFTAEQPEDV